jgi:uncharacterized protein
MADPALGSHGLALRCGTLFALGGGSSRMALTLAAMCAGAFVGRERLEWWSRLPTGPSIALGEAIGWTAAGATQAGILLALWIWLGARLRRRDRRSAPAQERRLYRAAALAALNWLTLLVAGHPWSVTWGFTLWGAKAAAASGWDATSSQAGPETGWRSHWGSSP